MRAIHNDNISIRFLRKVEPMMDDRGCWEWIGYIRANGYGEFHFNGAAVKAHRVALILAGIAVPDDRVVLHTCDNPACVNPAHLRVGTQADNLRDMAVKGRNYLPNPPKSDDKPCPRGHTGNFGRYKQRNGIHFGRRCMTCGKEWCREQRERRAAKSA